jgi:hypothetical protein
VAVVVVAQGSLRQREATALMPLQAMARRADRLVLLPVLLVAWDLRAEAGAILAVLVVAAGLRDLLAAMVGLEKPF